MPSILTRDSYWNGKGFETLRGTLKSIMVECYLSKLKLPGSNRFVRDCFLMMIGLPFLLVFKVPVPSSCAMPGFCSLH